MTKQFKWAVVTVFCLISFGCQSSGRSEGGPVSQSQTQQKTEPSVVAEVGLTPADRVEQAWKTFGNPQDPKSPVTEWVGVDQGGQLVVEGASLLDVPGWMGHPAVAQVFVRQPIRRAASGSEVTFGEVSRKTFRAWAPSSSGELPFSKNDVASYVDRWAVGTVTQRSASDADVTAWLERQLGKRLVNVQVEREGHFLVTATVRTGSLSEQERIVEAATLQAGLAVTANVQTVVVEYDDATAVKRIRVPSLSEWAKHGADLKLLRACVEVDGVMGTGCPIGGERKADGLAVLLGMQKDMQAGLPRGASLTVADAGFLRAVVQGEVPGEMERGQALSVYANAAENLFSASSDLFEVQLLLSRGDELEIFLFDRNQWSLRHFLTAQMGVSLPPGALVMTANEYQQYRWLKR